MIRHIAGTCIHQEGNSIIVDVHGVGFHVFTSPQTISESLPGESVSIWTYLAVRENALDLYGFSTLQEIHFFELLLTVSGIGPKSALAILSIASLEELIGAIQHNNPAYLTKVSGVGKKSAEKIILELRDKVGTLAVEGDEKTNGDMEALEALEALGYPSHIAREALRTVSRDVTDTSEKVRAALKHLGS